MDAKRIELYNTGYVDRKYIKPVTNCFCAAVMHECGWLETSDLMSGYKRVKGFLLNCCERHPRIGIKPITETTDLLEIFFNQKNSIPAYVYFWFDMAYSNIFGDTAEYSHKHTYVYNELQRIYIDGYRQSKRNDREDLRFNRLQRRNISKAFRSGDYDATFKLCNKPFADFMDMKEVKRLSDLLVMLFPEFCSFSTPEEQTAAGYILGRMQGRADSKNAPERGGRYA